GDLGRAVRPAWRNRGVCRHPAGCHYSPGTGAAGSQRIPLPAACRTSRPTAVDYDWRKTRRPRSPYRNGGPKFYRIYDSSIKGFSQRNFDTRAGRIERTSQQEADASATTSNLSRLAEIHSSGRCRSRRDQIGAGYLYHHTWISRRGRKDQNRRNNWWAVNLFSIN